MVFVIVMESGGISGLGGLVSLMPRRDRRQHLPLLSGLRAVSLLAFFYLTFCRTPITYGVLSPVTG